MFNNFNLSDQEILKIIDDYKNLINKNSIDRRLLSIFIKEETNSTLYKCATLNVKPL